MGESEADEKNEALDGSEPDVDETVEYVEVEVPGGPAWCWGTGRRKTSVARVRIRPGDGKIEVNRKPHEAYFTLERHRRRALAPLQAARLEGLVDVFANIHGGGITGQADAMLMGLARAILKYDENAEAVLRQAGHLTRDSRKVERKKYGRSGARRSYQYSKR